MSDSTTSNNNSSYLHYCPNVNPVVKWFYEPSIFFLRDQWMNLRWMNILDEQTKSNCLAMNPLWTMFLRWLIRANGSKKSAQCVFKETKLMSFLTSNTCLICVLHYFTSLMRIILHLGVIILCGDILIFKFLVLVLVTSYLLWVHKIKFSWIGLDPFPSWMWHL